MSFKSFERDYHHHQHHHDPLQFPVKQETSPVMTINNNNPCPRMPHSSLKIHRDSHIIKKSPPLKISSSSGPNPSRVTSLARYTNKPQHEQQRGPVIIYTHSPKVIHTNPKDFMALVQKLTGMSSPEGASHKDHHAKEDRNTLSYHPEQLINVAASNKSGNTNSKKNINNYNNNNDENESTSVITDENCSSGGNTSDRVGELNFGIAPPLFDSAPSIPQEASVSNFPFFMPNSSDLLYYTGDPSVYDYMNSCYPCNPSTLF